MQENKKDKIETADVSKFQPPYKEKYENLKKLLYSIFNQLEKIQNVIDSMEQEERKSYYQGIPGVEGTFDGQYLIAGDGRKTEVPENYAAKSRLVYGDILKVFTDSGKQVFKQIDRVERKKIEGVLAKKEGRWYLLSDSGSYRVSDASADFNGAQLNDKATAYVPLNNLNSPWAALDEVLGRESGKGGKTPGTKKFDSSHRDVVVNTFIKNKEKSSKINEVRKNSFQKSGEEKKSLKTKSKPTTRVIELKNEEKRVKPVEDNKKEFVNNILEDDDLR